MLRIFTKLALLWAYIEITFSLYARNDTTAAWVVGGLLLALGLVSFNRDIAIHGDREMPGILPVFSLILLVGPFCLFYLLPIELYEFGLSSRVPDHDRWDVLAIMLSGVFMALYIWIPLLCYHLIDVVAARWVKVTTQTA